MLEQKMTDLLAQLSSKLGVATEKIWEWALLQVKVEIITTIVMSAIIMLACYITYKVIRRFRGKWEGWLCDYEPFSYLVVLVWFMLLSILVIVSIFDLCQLPQYFINPEYSAFEIIVKNLSKIK